MKLFYGNYAALQEKLISFVAQERKEPLEKWLIVCASSPMRETLQRRMVGQFGAVANVHFISASGLMEHLDQEAGGDILPLFPQDQLRDFLLKEILQQPDLARYAVTRGLLQAVKSSLRDLADSCVTPEALAEYEQSLPDDALVQDRERLRWLVRLYKCYGEREGRVKGFRSYQEVYERALEQVEKSAFLQSFSQILIYGFYDMPGRQWDLISRVRSNYKGAVFVPYEKLPAYQFAERFFTTNWLSAGGEALAPVPCALGAGAKYMFGVSGSAPAPNVSVVSALNGAGEIFFTAKEILRLHEEEHIAFKDIGVIARTAGVYQDEVRRVFRQHGIALDASFNYPLSAYAFGNFCLRLFALAERGFAREEVLALVDSPYFKHPRKRAWAELIRVSLVKRDLSQWHDLLPYTKGYDAELLACLDDISNRLTHLAQAQSWQDGAAAAQGLLADYTDTACLEGKEPEIYRAVWEELGKLTRYGLLRERAEQGEIPAEINDALGALTFNETESSSAGVTFTDAVRARGMQFKVAFVLGVNDKSFPMLTPEDPLLRDYYRYIVRDVLGYWINGSLERGAEEKMLFYFALCSAREKLYVLYNRYNSDGKDAIPSLFITELSRACELGIKWGSRGLSGERLHWVSGRLEEQLQATKMVYWTPKELSYAFVLHPQTARGHYQAAGLLSAQKENTLTAAAALAQQREVSAFDGFIQSGPEIFRACDKNYFSPSSLQKLATCPFKYFMEKGLKLGREEEPLCRHDLSSNHRGTLLHEVLRDFYQTLKEKNLTHALFDSGAVAFLEESFAKHIHREGYRRFGIYPLVWKFILEDMHKELCDFVVADLQQLGSYTPAYFEKELFLPPTEQLPFHVQGKLDRIDIDEAQKLFFVVDYKSSRKWVSTLAESFHGKLFFQPLLYVYMVQHSGLLQGYQAGGSALSSVTENKRDVFSPEQYREACPRACAFLVQLTDYIKAGTFFIAPSTDNCKYCPFGAICRKETPAALQRLSKNASSQSLKEARQCSKKTA